MRYQTALHSDVAGKAGLITSESHAGKHGSGVIVLGVAAAAAGQEFVSGRHGDDRPDASPGGKA